MNCKPGDLAVIVSGDMPENTGRFVEVIRPGEQYGDGVYHWLVRSVGSPLKFRWFDGYSPLDEFGFDLDIDVADSDLRRIRDPGGDASDQMLRPLPESLTV